MNEDLIEIKEIEKKAMSLLNENKRLKQKIEQFKAYDEERKVYYSGIIKQLKSLENQITQMKSSNKERALKNLRNKVEYLKGMLENYSKKIEKLTTEKSTILKDFDIRFREREEKLIEENKKLKKDNKRLKETISELVVKLNRQGENK